MGKKKPLAKAITMAVSCLFILAGIAGVYIYQMQKTLTQELKQSLQQVAAATTASVEDRIHERMTTLENLALMLRNEPSSDRKILLKELEGISEQNQFLRLGITDTEGNCLTSDGFSFNVKERIYFKKAMQGESSFSDTIIDKVSGIKLNVFAVPIYHKNQITNVLFGSCDTQKLANDLLLTIYEGEGFSTIGDNTGAIILQSSKSKADKNLKNLQELEFIDNFSIATLKTKGKGIVRFKATKNDEVRYMAYEQMKYNNWFVYSVVPVSVVTARINEVIRIASITWLLFALIISGIIFYMYFAKIRNDNKIAKVVFFDELTQHDNYNRFRIDVQDLIDAHKQTNYTLIEFDVRDFKMLNELYGYHGGDMVLKATMRLCVQECQHEEYCARISADRFIMLWKQRDRTAILQRYQKLIALLQQELKGISDQFKADYYAGFYLLQAQDTDFSKCHDRCAYAKNIAKKEKQDGWSFYSDTMYEELLFQKKVESQMESALQNGEFKLYLQPKITLQDGFVHSAEALTRWDSPTLGFISPGAFIPIFERNGFLEQLDMYMLGQVCLLLKQWRNTYPDFRISVNVSRMYIFKQGFAQRMKRIVESHGIPVSAIELEITESVIFDHSHELYIIIKELQSYGFSVSMDDFGSGYSSLNMLKDIPIDVIKLDQVFFQSMEEETKKRAKCIVAGMLKMAKNLGIASVAEGIENGEEVEFLKETGCDEIQGFYYSKPLSVADFLAYLKENKEAEDE